MTFQPVIPISGYAGWRFLTRTAATQQENLAKTPAMQRDVDAFRERIGSIATASDLVKDRQLLKVALGAFGLDADLPNKAFVEKVLDSAAGDPKALANRLADKRYRDLSQTFGFGNEGNQLAKRPDIVEKLVRAYETRQFEIAVGDQNEDMRLALTATRELAELSSSSATDRTLWLTVLGQPPLRRVFETALGLPKSFGSIDLDQQVEVFRSKSERAFGSDSIRQFADKDRREELVRSFMVRAEMQSSPASVRGSTALTLLQSIPPAR
jgi:hypothetical protein